MVKQIQAIGLAAFFSLCLSAQAAEVQKFGQPLGDAKATPIAEIAKNPAAFAGKEVTVAGKVCGVCTMAGCWMELEQDNARLRIKVNDGEMVFPADSVGSEAKARGTVKLIDMNRDQYIAWKRHEAEELGQKFDEKSVGDGPYRNVQISGVAAEIKAGE